MDEIKLDLKEMKADMSRMSDSLVKNTATLEIHVARTGYAEKRLDAIETFNHWWLGIMAAGVLGIFFHLLVK